MIAVCGGALRRYLRKHDELPAPTLVSIAPVSRRNGNAVARGYSLLQVPLRTDIADPVERLRTIKHFVANVDDVDQAVNAKELTDSASTHRPRRSRCRQG